VPRPWTDGTLELGAETTHHLSRVLRLPSDSSLSYTDGRGWVGSGRLTDAGVLRGEEHLTEHRPNQLTMAVAAPKAAARQRFVVEKLVELGVDRLVWLKTRRGEGRAPRSDKAKAWAIASLEQSRRAFLMEIAGPDDWRAVAPDSECFVADPGGALPGPDSGRNVAVFVGPEGGFDADELPDRWPRVAVSDGVLRVETAAIVGASAFLALWR
jgi:16S rRNA (uracil1498-N3)-methyltransferase